MRKIWIALLAAVVLGTGCVGLQPVPGDGGGGDSMVSRYRIKALKYENAGEYQKAMLSWEVVKGLKPSDKEANEKIDYLNQTRAAQADKLIKEGLDYYRIHDYASAESRFVAALQYDPRNTQAIDYLKNIPQAMKFRSYKVANRSDLAGLARQYYGDSTKAGMIAYFNGLTEKDRVQAGATLEIPILDMRLKRRLAGLPIYQPRPVVTTARPSQPGTETSETQPEEETTASIEPKEEMPTIDVEGELGTARTLYQARNYGAVVPAAEKVLASDPGNAEATKLLNDSAFQLGKTLSRQKDYVTALRMLNKVSPNYPGASEAISSVRTVMEKQAEVHYRRGVKFFVNEQLAQAISEWRETLKYNPDHPKAQKDIENAQGLLEKLKSTK
ncbi:MAG: tetratricopeptide repeat protein [Proteobacteria bacterium]|nr:tetratricopeptide repeat protein [Pseudomonadota bacterium]